MGASRAMRLRISTIKEQESNRHAGYLSEVLSSGIVSGDFLELSAEAHAALRTKYRPSAPSAPVSRLTPSTASDHEKQGRISGCCDRADQF